MTATGHILDAGILKTMSTEAAKTPAKKNRATDKQPRWVYVVGVIAVICFLLGFTPGGEAMWTLDIWLCSWAVAIYVLRKYGFRGAVKVILLGLGALLLLSFLII